MRQIITILLVPLLCFAEKDQPIELGSINWTRNFNAALEKSAETNKPVFLLFQEVPGCYGCKKFGAEVLSDSVIKRAVETEFIPLFIYNNRGGKDAEILKRYKEPSWNYQVVRFLDSEGKDLIPRKDKVWTTEGIKQRIIQALKAAGKDVPSYITNKNAKLSEAWFAMFCYWTGEMELGGIDGVKQTEAGYFEGSEVTKVLYNENEISLRQLAEKAAKVDCARKVFVSSNKQKEQLKDLRLKVGFQNPSGYKTASEDNQKKQLNRFDLSGLELTEYQLTKLNAFINKDPKKALSYLSAEQKAALLSTRNN